MHPADLHAAPGTATTPRLTPPPRIPPRRPATALPPGAVDTHLHMFGPLERYPFVADAPYLSDDATDEMYFGVQAVLGLSKAVLVSGGGYGQTFDHLLDMLCRNPDRLRGVVRLPASASTGDIDMLHAAGVRGARFFGRNLDALTGETLALIDRVGWHVQFQPDVDSLPDVAARLLGLNRVVVLDHFAKNSARDGRDSPANRTLFDMLDTGRVWVKISGPMRVSLQEHPYPEVTPIARALIRHAPERVLWGSDWPHTNLWGRTMPDDGDLVDLLAHWTSDAATLERILVTNPHRLYGFDS